MIIMSATHSHDDAGSRKEDFEHMVEMIQDRFESRVDKLETSIAGLHSALDTHMATIITELLKMNTHTDSTSARTPRPKPDECNGASTVHTVTPPEVTISTFCDRLSHSLKAVNSALDSGTRPPIVTDTRLVFSHPAQQICSQETTGTSDVHEGTLTQKHDQSRRRIVSGRELLHVGQHSSEDSSTSESDDDANEPSAQRGGQAQRRRRRKWGRYDLGTAWECLFGTPQVPTPRRRLPAIVGVSN
jgi:hypothetical protein